MSATVERRAREPGVAEMLALVLLEWVGVHALAGVFGLAAEVGTMVAGLLVVATFAPMLAREPRLLLTPGETREEATPGSPPIRRSTAVAFVSLGGYEALARRDERAARHAATRLRHAVRAACASRSLRVAPSMGDAVMIEGPDAYGMAEALLEIRAAFPALSPMPGLPALEVRAGAHAGDVIEAPDGSLGGAVVILAWRLQAASPGGQLACSLAFARAAGLGPGRLRRLGARAMGASGQVVDCFSLLRPAASLATN